MSSSLPLDKPVLTPGEKRSIWFSQVAYKFRDWARFDSRVLRGVYALASMLAASCNWLRGRKERAMQLGSSVHRAACSTIADGIIERRIVSLRRSDRAFFEAHIDRSGTLPSSKVFVDTPERLLGSRVLVIKSPGNDEKGAIAIDYSFAIPLFARLFDVRKVAERYHLTLEPSWSGFCDPDVLSYLAYDFPVFLQAIEPRDAQFIERLGANLIPVPIAANWWVDHRIFKPVPGIRKDADVIMIAGWSKFKRHAAVFSALSELRRRGHALRMLVVGYPGGDLTRDDIHRLASYYGVTDQLEIHEYVPAERVNELYNRCRVNLLWSRREGFNRAIIEGFCAGTPGIMCSGFNYGYQYPYINERTGVFAPDNALADNLLHVVQNSAAFAPREWVLENMSCHRATEILDAAIGKYSSDRGEKWSGGLTVKVSHLNTMGYWNPEDRARFAEDYEFLRSVRR